MELETIWLGSDLVIVTENVDGEIYIIRSKYIKDVIDDWNGECNIVPENDARVFFAAWNGEPISPYEHPDFWTLIEYLKAKIA